MFCVFPEVVDAVLRTGVVGRAMERGVVDYRSFDLRGFAPDGRIDDMPYGGGAGMVVRVDVVARAFEEVYGVPARDVKERAPGDAHGARRPAAGPGVRRGGRRKGPT